MGLPKAYGDGFAGESNRNVGDPDAVLYVLGNETTDGSLRLLPETLNTKEIKFEQRLEGVWNPTGIEVAAASINLGLDLLISAAGRYINTFDVISGDNALAPHHPFSDAGSVPQPHTAVLGPLAIKVPVITDESTEIISTIITAGVPSPTDILVSKLYLKTGSVAATAPVSVTFHRGVDDTGPVFFKKVLPTSLFAVTETEIEIGVEGLIQIVANAPIHGVFESEEVFSLRADAVGAITFSVDVRSAGEEDILTDSFVLANDLSIAFDNEGNLTRHNHRFV